MFIPSCIFIVFSKTTGNKNTQPIIPCSSPFLLYCLGPLLVLQTTMSLGILSYRHQKLFCSELPLHPKQQSLSRDKEVCAESFGHWMPLLIQQRSADEQRHLQEKYVSSLSQMVLSLFHLKKCLLAGREKHISLIQQASFSTFVPPWISESHFLETNGCPSSSSEVLVAHMGFTSGLLSFPALLE